MALSDLVLDCKLNKKQIEFIFFCSLFISLVYEITNASRVDMSDFELLKVLGTGGRDIQFCFSSKHFDVFL